MREIIIEIVEFVKSGRSADTLQPIANKIEAPILKRIFENLLFWMLTRHVNKKSLLLMTSWQKQLGDIIRSEPEFSRLFVLKGDYVDYADNVDPALRDEIVAWVRDNWRPTVVGDPILE